MQKIQVRGHSAQKLGGSKARVAACGLMEAVDNEVLYYTRSSVFNMEMESVIILTLLWCICFIRKYGRIYWGCCNSFNGIFLLMWVKISK